MKSIKNNKIFLFVLIIFTFIISPLFVFAAVPPTVKLELATEDQNKQTAKWSWVFNIKTADSVAVVGDGLVTISLFKKNATTGVFEKDTSDTPILINNNIGTFYTGSVLDSLTTYQVKAVYTNQNRTASDTFEKSTAEGIIRDITGTPADRSTVIGSDTPVIITPQTNAPAGSAVSTVYKFLAPIGLGDTIDTTDIGVYFSWIFKLAIGLCAALAVIMIIIASVQYMGDESIFGKTEAKDKILKAILGLLIAIGSWVLLNTINPALTGQGGVNVANVSISVSDAQQYRLALTQNTTGVKTFKRSPYYSQIKTISTTNGIPNCLMQVAIQRESGGISSVGHDEDVPSVNVPSRRDFIASGKKFDGTTFTPGNKSDPRITQSSFKNSDHPSLYTKAMDPNKADLGLDWRFSHSVGMFGITFGINHLDQTGAQSIYNNSNADIIKATSIIKAFYKQCNSNVEGTWRAYNSGKCDGNNAFTNTETAIRVNLYNQCVAQDN
jgi:hypothetical protein